MKSEKRKGFKKIVLIKYVFEYLMMMNRNTLSFLGAHWCVVTKKEIIRSGGGGTTAYILWLKTEGSDYSGFIFVGPDDYDRTEVNRRFDQLGVVHNKKRDRYKFTKNLAEKDAIDEIVKEAKKYLSYVIAAVAIGVIFYSIILVCV